MALKSLLTTLTVIAGDFRNIWALALVVGVGTFF